VISAVNRVRRQPFKEAILCVPETGANRPEFAVSQDDALYLAGCNGPAKRLLTATFL
jgi:hypothetical protein